MKTFFPSASVVLVLAAALAAQGATRFAAPVRLEAGTKRLGEARLYPSPVLHDVNGDGLLDIVVGDLRGRITFALREKTAAGAPPRFQPEQKWMAADGEEIDFHNW